MLPGVSGFAWDLPHVIFLGAFFSVATVLAVTVALASSRAVHDVRSGEWERIRWEEDFHDLPCDARCCRHAITGSAPGRVCERGFDCRHCPDHARLAAGEGGEGEASAATRRRFHRGHTWAEPRGDGSWVVGLDEVAAQALGRLDQVQLPPVGAALRGNGVGWVVRVGRDVLRVLSPIPGRVVETSDGRAGWFLRVRPSEAADVVNLLAGEEARTWLEGERERVRRAGLGLDPGMAPHAVRDAALLLP